MLCLVTCVQVGAQVMLVKNLELGGSQMLVSLMLSC